MKSISLHLPWHSLTAAFLIPLLAFLLACGPGEEPTPAPTATPTQAPVGEPTIPGEGPVATPTPTTEAAPVPTPSEKPKYGGRMLYLNSQYAPDYDAHNLYTAGFDPLNLSLYSTLFRPTRDERGPKGEVYCELCTDWYLEDAGKTMVFNIIQGIKYHDGTEMTSADIAYSLKKIMGEIDGVASQRSSSIREYITSIDTPSRYQVKVHMRRPSAYVPKVLTFSHSAIFPDGTTRAMLKDKPYGSGPFVLGKTVSGASMSFERNPNYFVKGLPYIDGIDQVVVVDASTREAAFLTGKQLISAIFAPQYMAMLNGLVAQGKMNLGINPAGCGITFLGWPNPKLPFTDIRVRQAINLSQDRKALAEIGYGEYGLAHLLHFAEGQVFATPEEEIWNVVPGWGTGAKKQQEIEQARKLLVDAGFPNGMDLEAISQPLTAFSYGATNEPSMQMLAAIGIRTKLTPALTTPLILKMTTLDYQITSYQGCLLSGDPDEVISTSFLTGAARNLVGYSNSEVDRLFPLMSGELDVAKRKELFFKIQDIIVVETVGYAPKPRNANFIWSWASLKDYHMGLTGLSYTGNKFDYVWIDR